MKAIDIDRPMAYLLAKEAADWQMRAERRACWNIDDANLAVRRFDELWGLEREYPWASPVQIMEMARQLGYDWRMLAHV